MSPEGFEPTISTIERMQSHAVDRAQLGWADNNINHMQFIKIFNSSIPDIVPHV